MARFGVVWNGTEYEEAGMANAARSFVEGRHSKCFTCVCSAGMLRLGSCLALPLSSLSRSLLLASWWPSGLCLWTLGCPHFWVCCTRGDHS